MENNPVCWFEIRVKDLARAGAFYETVLGVKLSPLPSPLPDLEMLAFPMDRDNHGISGTLVRAKGQPPSDGGTLVYFQCADCAVEAGRAEAAGGKVLQKKMSLGEYGFMAHIRDTEGNRIGLHSMA